MENPFEVILSFAPPHLRLAVLITVLLVSCDGTDQSNTSQIEADKARVAAQSVPIQETRVTEIEITDPIVTTGTISALKTTDISPMVSGLVEEVYVSVGDRVKKGDPLLKIRQTEIKLKIAQLEHRKALATAELDNAKKDLGTNLGLTRIGAISQERTDDTQTLFDIARARLGIAEAQLLQAQQDLGGARRRPLRSAPFARAAGRQPGRPG